MQKLNKILILKENSIFRRPISLLMAALIVLGAGAISSGANAVTFTSDSTFASGNGEIHSADLDGVNGPDLIADGPRVYLNNGDGTFATEIQYGADRGVAISDVDGVNGLDLISIDANTVSVLLNNGDGTFATAVDYAVMVFPSMAVSVFCADVDGVNGPDILVEGGELAVLLNNGDGTFAADVEYDVNGGDELYLHDVDGINGPDVIVHSRFYQGFSLYLNNGDGTFAGTHDGSFPNAVDYNVSVYGGISIRDMNMFDVDGQNGLDLIYSSSGFDELVVVLNNGDGTFDHYYTTDPFPYANVTTYPLLAVPEDMTYGNFDNILGDDLAAASYGDDMLSVILNNGDGTFDTRQDLATSSRPLYLAAADFDGDGLDDIALSFDNGGGNISILLNTTDLTPDAFTFTDSTSVALSSTQTSNTITLAGLEEGVVISITGGFYKLNTDAYTNVAGIAYDGDEITVQHTASAGNNTSIDTVLTVGGVSDTYTSTTLTDTIPNAFSFTDQTNVALSSYRTSNALMITGLGASSPVSITGGEYNINSTGFVSTAGFINNNDSIYVRGMSSASNNTAVDVSLTIGGINDIFKITTLVDVIPNAFVFTDQANAALSAEYESDILRIDGLAAASPISITSGDYRINGGAYTNVAGTINNNDMVQVRGTASASNSTDVDVSLSIGGVNDVYKITTLADVIPGAFAFTDQTNAALSAEYESDILRIDGLAAASPISITSGDYRINGGAYTSIAGTINNNDTVQVRGTSSASNSTDVDVSLSIGGVNDVYKITTLVDAIPDAFSFTDQTNATLSTLYESNTLTITGLDVTTTISVSFGHYRINGGAYTNGASTINNNDTVQVRGASSANNAADVDVLLTIGGVTDTYKITTLGDAIPDNFVFTDQVDALLSTEYESNVLTVAGLGVLASISITGGEYRINGGAYTNVAATINNGDTFQVRATSPVINSSELAVVLSIGGVSDTYTISTIGDSIPHSFTFSSQIDVALNAQLISETINIDGIDTAVAISVSAGEYQINNGVFTSLPGTVNDGDQVSVRLSASSDYETTTTMELTVGSYSASYSLTTVVAPVVETVVEVLEVPEDESEDEDNSQEVVAGTATAAIIVGQYISLGSFGYFNLLLMGFGLSLSRRFPFKK